MRVHAVGPRPTVRLLILATTVVVLAALVSGAAAWSWTQAARLISLEPPMWLPDRDAARAMWQLITHGGWSNPQTAFPTQGERASAPEAWAYATVAVLCLAFGARVGLMLHRLIRDWRSGSPLGKGQRTLARRAVDGGWIRQRTWALPNDLRRLWVPGPVSGRPYLGVIGRLPTRTLAAEHEVQPMVIAPPRSGKSTGFVIPWLLDHDGPALVLSTKRDIYEATAAHRGCIGRVWVYDPFGEQPSTGFTPLTPASTWAGAIRTGRRSHQPRTPTSRMPRTSSGTRRRRACSRRCFMPPHSAGTAWAR